MSGLDAEVGVQEFAKYILAVAALAPGFLIAFVRSSFITGRLKSISENLFEYVVSSSIYYSATIPTFFWLREIGWWTLLFVFFFFPAVIGFTAGVVAQKNLLARCLNCFGLKIAHPMPTSWDFLFGNLRSGSWVVITLKNHEKIFGFFGGASFASSDLSRRDLYIEDIRDNAWNRIEPDGRARGLWVSEEEICMVELVTDEVRK